MKKSIISIHKNPFLFSPDFDSNFQWVSFNSFFLILSFFVFLFSKMHGATWSAAKRNGGSAQTWSWHGRQIRVSRWLHAQRSQHNSMFLRKLDRNDTLVQRRYITRYGSLLCTAACALKWFGTMMALEPW